MYFLHTISVPYPYRLTYNFCTLLVTQIATYDFFINPSNCKLYMVFRSL